MVKFYILSFLALCIGAINVISISSGRKCSNCSLEGSAAGGTVLYIRAVGLAADQTSNIVQIGPYPCRVIDVTASQFLACVTTPATNNSQMSNLPVRVSINRQKEVLCSLSNCFFNYKEALTPKISILLPKAATAHDQVLLFGNHLFTDADSSQLQVGHFQMLIPSSPESPSYLKVKIADHMYAGFYNITLSSDEGLGIKSPIMLRQSPIRTSDPFEILIVPSITMNTHQGSTAGVLSKITGTGLSLNKNDFTCQIFGLTCEVEPIDSQSILISIPPKQKIMDQAKGRLQSLDNSTIFLTSGGLNYTRYKCSENSLNNIVFNLRKNSSYCEILDSGIRTEINSNQSDLSPFVQHFSGYFFSPVAGIYKFTLNSDDSSQVYSSRQANSSDTTLLQTFLKLDGFNPSSTNPYISNQSSQFKSVYLDNGYYYFEVYHQNSQGNNHLSLSVEIPIQSQSGIGTNWEIQQIDFRPQSITPQILQIQVVATSGSFALNYTILQTKGLVTYNSTMIPFNASDEQLITGFKTLPCFQSYSPKITVLSIPGGQRWIIQIDKFRPLYCQNVEVSIFQQKLSLNATTSFKIVQTHSPALSGYYQLYFQDYQVYYDNSPDIPYETNATKLAEIIRLYLKNPEIQVSKVTSTTYETGVSFIISFIGQNGPQPQAQLNVSKLKGGKNGTSPIASTRIIKKATLNKFYNTIPYELLYLGSSNPGLKLTVNGISALCQDCSFQYESNLTPTVISMNLLRQVLQITMDPTVLPAKLSDYSVNIEGQQCSSLAGSPSSFTCLLPVNLDRSVQLPGGSYKPIIYVSGFGYADFSNNVSNLTLPLTINSVTPNEGSTQGGLIIAISGVGLPLNNRSQIKIFFCSTEGEIVTYGNQLIKVRVPKQTHCDDEFRSYLKFGNNKTTFLFNYNQSLTPSIQSLSSNNSSPLINKTVCINGQKFGSDITKISAFLMQSSNLKYKLKILNVADNIVCIEVGKGSSGRYWLSLIIDGKGASKPVNNYVNQYSYGIYIHKITPNFGAIGGGTIISIEGENFLSNYQLNKVLIGSKQCKIINSTENNITCQTPPSDDHVQSNLSVRVIQRTQISTCSFNECIFSYVSAVSAKIQTPLKSIFTTYQTVTYTGFNLQEARVIVGGVNSEVTYNTDKLLSFKMPKLKFGEYQVVVKTNYGYAYPPQKVQNRLIPGLFSSKSGSRIGNIITFTGQGLTNTTQDPDLFVTLDCRTQKMLLKIMSADPLATSFRIPAGNLSPCNLIYQYKSILQTSPYSRSSSLNISFSISPNHSPIKKNHPHSFLLKTKFNTSIQVLSIMFESVNTKSLTLSNPIQAEFEALNNNNIFKAQVFLPAGLYQVLVLVDGYGFADMDETVSVAFPSLQLQQNAVLESGSNLVIYGPYFNAKDENQNIITVCGLEANISAKTSSSLTFKIPNIGNTFRDSTVQLLTAKIISDTQGESYRSYAFDSLLSTSYNSSAQYCYIGYDFGSELLINLTTVIYIVDPYVAHPTSKFYNATFQGSLDGANWTVLHKIGSQLNSGIMSFEINTQQIFRFVRFSHTNTSRCQLSELRIEGKTSLPSSPAPQYCDVTINNTATSNSTTFQLKTKYDPLIPVVTNFHPLFASMKGQQALIVTGFNFGDSNTILIDQIPCQITSQTNTQISCIIPKALTAPKGDFSFQSSGKKAKLIVEPFKYAYSWSQKVYWGNQSGPSEGDDVNIAIGTVLIVDESPPLLGDVTIDGTLFFQDKADILFRCKSIKVSETGSIIAGSQTFPFIHLLTIELFQKKVIECIGCRLDLFGKSHKIVWTELQTTALAGSSIISVIDEVDWEPESTILISTTDFFVNQTSYRKIKSLQNNKTIELDSPLSYTHLAITIVNGSGTVSLRAKVGIINRNIIIKGNVAQNEGISVKISSNSYLKPVRVNFFYVQLFNCGKIFTEDHCLEFKGSGFRDNINLNGNSIHHSYSRGISIRRAKFIKIHNNVLSTISGHAVYLGQGFSQDNQVIHNLITNIKNTDVASQSDLQATGILLSNPNNKISENSIIGSEYAGIVYKFSDIQERSFQLANICPIGLPVLQSQNNSIYSCAFAGMIITQHTSKQFPCEINSSLASKSVLSNFTFWRNKGTGFIAINLSNILLNGFKVIQNLQSGIDIYLSNSSVQGVVISQTLVIGYTNDTTQITNLNYNKARGIRTPRTEGLTISKTTFVNFANTMIPIEICVDCSNELEKTSGNTIFTSEITFKNIENNFISWRIFRNNIIIDQDGSLALPITKQLSLPAYNSSSITPYTQFLEGSGNCFPVTQLWNGSLVCNSILRSLTFKVINPEFLVQSQLKISINSKTSALNAIKTKNDYNNVWIVPFQTQQMYQVQWKNGSVYQFQISQSSLWSFVDTVILKISYYEQLQNIQVKRWVQNRGNKTFLNISEIGSVLLNKCSNGDYQFDSALSVLTLCISGKSSNFKQNINIKTTPCQTKCKPSNYRLWSDKTLWPSGSLPGYMENVTIQSTEKVILDIDTPQLSRLNIKGELLYNVKKNVTLQASIIQISGSLLVTNDQRSTHSISTIKLIPLVDTDWCGIVVQPGGTLKMSGISNNILFRTHLKALALRGSTQILVQSSDGWSSGDSLVIGPSYSNQLEGQTVTIDSINGTIVKLKTPLQYEHFGDTQKTIINSYGILDTRAEVGLLTRNIRIKNIKSGTQSCSIMSAGDGILEFHSVQIQGGGHEGYQSVVQIRDQQSSHTIIQNSVIYNCEGVCLNIDNSSHLNISNNILYSGRGSLAKVNNTNSLNFTKNLMINAKQLSNLSNNYFAEACCYEHYPNFIEGILSDNICQGSEGIGFVLPFVECSQMSTGKIKNNLAGSCKIGFLINTVDASINCIGASGMQIYACQIGLMANPSNEHKVVIYQGIMAADCSRTITLRSGYDARNNTIVLRNSFIAGFSRPLCKTCYSDKAITYCKNAFAVRMFSVTQSGQTYPTNKDITTFDAIRSQQGFDAKAFISNVTFENYLSFNILLPYCSGMSVFRRHPMAMDGTASHYLTNSICNKCQSTSLARFQASTPTSRRPVYQGCGNLPCSGPNNYFIQDNNGSFLGFTGQLLANNSWIGQAKQSCKLNKRINGYFCQNTSFAILEFESNDPNPKIIWPVVITPESNFWKTKTSPWRSQSWSWRSIPSSRPPLSRFWSVIELGQSYHLKYSSESPVNSLYQLQKRQHPFGKDSDWIILTLSFSASHQNLFVFVTDDDQNETILESSLNQTLNTSKCGSNYVNFFQRTVKFVVNSKSNCLVSIKVYNYIKLKSKLDIPLSQFNFMKEQTFRNNLAAFLSIKRQRIQIRKLQSGSTIVTSTISADLQNQKDDRQELVLLTNVIATGIKKNLIDLGAPVLDISYQINISEQIKPPANEINIKNQVIGLAVVAAIVACTIIISCIIYKRYSVLQSKVHPEVEVNESKVSEGNQIAEKNSTSMNLDHLQEKL